MSTSIKKVLSVILVICFAAALFSTAAAAPLTQKPLVHLKFEDNFKDSSGGNYDGTKLGNVTFASDGPAGKCAEFKGGYLEINNNESVNFNKGISLSAWVKLDPDADLVQFPIIEKPRSDDPGAPILFFYLGYGGTALSASLGYGEDSNGLSDANASFDLDETTNIDQWCHVAFVLDGTDQKYYVNGTLVDKLPVDPEILEEYKNLGTSKAKIRIGKAPEYVYRGKLDEVMIFNATLTDDDIAGIYEEVMGAAGNNKMVLQIDNPMMFVNDQQKEIDPDVGTAPTVIEGRTLVPIRAIIEAMGGTIGWDGNEKRVDINARSKTISLWLGNLKAKVDGQDKTLDVPPMSINDRTMVPIRFVSENLGCRVEWDGASQKITISY